MLKHVIHALKCIALGALAFSGTALAVLLCIALVTKYETQFFILALVMILLFIAYAIGTSIIGEQRDKDPERNCINGSKLKQPCFSNPTKECTGCSDMCYDD